MQAASSAENADLSFDSIEIMDPRIFQNLNLAEIKAMLQNLHQQVKAVDDSISHVYHGSVASLRLAAVKAIETSSVSTMSLAKRYHGSKRAVSNTFRSDIGTPNKKTDDISGKYSLNSLGANVSSEPPSFDVDEEASSNSDIESLVYDVKVKVKIRAYAPSLLHDIRRMDGVSISELIESLSPVFNRQAIFKTNQS